jgi:nucleobase transporter 1/2
MCHFPIFERFSVLISIALVWLYAQILTVSGAYKHSPVLTQLNCRTDRANLITTAPWSVDWCLLPLFYIFSSHYFTLMEFIYLSEHFLRIRLPYPLQWGPPTFSADHSFGMMAAVVVSLIEVINTPLSSVPCNVQLVDIMLIWFVWKIFWALQSTAAFQAAARLASATPPPPFVMSRGIGCQVS